MIAMSDPDHRVIEDFLPVGVIGAEATRERSLARKHISSLHRWWARRPLVACRVAVYGALVPIRRFRPEGAGKRDPDRATREAVAKFIGRLCEYPGSAETVNEARAHILEAHAERLGCENQVAGAPDLPEETSRPRVLDMFAGGGGIPLEALRLGCEAHALDLNPVAHIVQLCSLVYPQRYRKVDTGTAGVTGTKHDGHASWGGLANEVRYWGNVVLEKVRDEISDIYPSVMDRSTARTREQTMLSGIGAPDDTLSNGLIPIAYRWTRTVQCKNISCSASVPLLRNLWLCSADRRYVALKPVISKKNLRVRYKVVEAKTEKELGFDPTAGSIGGNAICPFCGTVADTEYVKAEGCAGRMGHQMIGIVCSRPGTSGKRYFSADDLPGQAPDEEEIRRRIDALIKKCGIDAPTEPLPPKGAIGFGPQPYGMKEWGDVFIPRQLLCLLTFVSNLREVETEMRCVYSDSERVKVVMTYLALIVDRLANSNSSLCFLMYKGGGRTRNTFVRPALPMVWDFAEANPFNPKGASWISGLKNVTDGLRDAGFDNAGLVQRGSATNLPWPNEFFDAVITDPPYYDNVPYADISDFFYVWLKRTVGHLYPDHFATELTPKKSEAVADPIRHNRDREKASRAYEEMMFRVFSETYRTLKPGAPLVVVYAHKTTRGWATLLDALRNSGFMVTEAWPLDTEKPGRIRAQNSSALASSIFLVARKRENGATGSYEQEVRPELIRIVTERVDVLWRMGISGADLVIAAVGAGLRAFSRFGCVEYDNGESVPAEEFLSEVEGAVLETLLGKIFGMIGSGVAAVDGPTRLYVLWRYTQKEEIDAGEAIVLTYGLDVELDGPSAISGGGSRALIQKKGAKFRIRDFSDRGGNEGLEMPGLGGAPAPLIDVLHRILWLVENDPRKIGKVLADVRPDRERLRLVAQVLAGPALDGSKSVTTPRLVGGSDKEEVSLHKLLTNWRTLIDRPSDGALFIEENTETQLI